MPKVEPADIRGGLNQSIGQYNLPLPGAGQREVGSALQGLGSVFNEIALDTQKRRNELMVNDAELRLRDVRRTALYGDGANDPGAFNVQGMDVVGITERTGQRLKDQFAEIEQTLENDVQRQAFRFHAERIIGSTIDALAAHESDAAEKARVASLAANYEESMLFYTSSQPTAFLSTSPRQRAEILSETELYIKGTNPYADDQTVETLASIEMANQAHQAAMSYLDARGPEAVPDARKFLNEYGDRWTTEQRRQMQAAVDHQTGLGVMQAIVPEVMAAAQDGGHESDAVWMRDEAVKRFERRYRDLERGAGKSPVPEQIDEMRRRMLAEVDLVEKSRKAREQRYDDQLIGGFWAVLTDKEATLSDVEAAYRKAQSQADPSRPGIFPVLYRFRDNFEKTSSPFTSETDAAGWSAYAMNDEEMRQTDAEEMWMHVSHMGSKEGKKFIDRWRSARSKSGPDLTSDIRTAINAARGRHGENALKTSGRGSAVMGAMVDTMESLLAARRERGDTSIPTMTELIDLADVASRSLNGSRPNFLETNTQTWAEFVRNPKPVDLKDPADLNLAKAGLLFMRTVPGAEDDFRTAVESRLGRRASEDEMLQALAQDPRYLSNLIRLGLSDASRLEMLLEVEQIGTRAADQGPTGGAGVGTD